MISNTGIVPTGIMTPCNPIKLDYSTAYLAS